MFLGKTLNHFLIAIAICFLSFSSFAMDNDNDTLARLEELKQSADNGSGFNAFKVGQYYEEQKNYEQAEYWYRKGTFLKDGASSLALYKLNENRHRTINDANMYKNIGFTRLTAAAEHDKKIALFLADAYISGKLLPANNQKAKEWFIKAEKMGSAIASYKLGLMYNEGLIAYKNPYRAAAYFQKADNSNIAEATRHLGHFYETGNGVAEKNMSKAKAYYEKAAKAGHVSAMVDLGNYYKHHKNDMDNAIIWYEKAATQGNADAQYYCGQFYKNINPKKSQQYFAMAKLKKHFLTEIELEKN